MVKIFTDGSCNPQKNIGAWAGIILIDNKKEILSGIEKETTHNRMELLAVINSIKFVNENSGINEMEIITDSQYVVGILERKNRLTEKKFITKKGNLLNNSDLISELIGMIENQKLIFTKIKAHQKKSDNFENLNIEADKLSRKLVRNEVIGNW